MMAILRNFFNLDKLLALNLVLAIKFLVVCLEMVGSGGFIKMDQFSHSIWGG